ncbi:MAG: hypothetical protein MK224_03440 [Candidatus Nitrosopelagicus sp.]|jgi:hypothetical protein|nr:hypothetical protein [Candidatus Nitrosopelagicus sp.]
MKFREIYCDNCKKSLGMYNVKYYSEHSVAEIIRIIHSFHSRAGHNIKIRKKKSEAD